MNDNTVSVIIPTYNSSRFIEKTLRSVFAQSYCPKELIVVDDASTDETCMIVEAMAVQSPFPLRLIRRRNGSGGPAVPLNEGCFAALGDWLSLLDHDDLMLPHKLELQMEAIEKTSSNFCFSNYETIDSTGKLSEGLRFEQLQKLESLPKHSIGAIPLSREFFLQEQVIDSGLVQSCSNLVFSRSLLGSVGGFSAEDSAIADYVFKLKITPLVKAIYVPKVLFQKRCHDMNLFDSSDTARLRSRIRRIGFSAVCSNPQLGNSKEFRRRWHEELIKNAYLNRCRLSFIESLSEYYCAWRYTGISSKLMAHIIKWPVGAFLDIWPHALTKLNLPFALDHNDKEEKK